MGLQQIELVKESWPKDGIELLLLNKIDILCGMNVLLILKLMTKYKTEVFWL